MSKPSREQFVFIPGELWDKKISLEKLGKSGLAWRLADCNWVLDSAQAVEVGVLGGDLFDLTEDGWVEYTHVNWYTNHETHEANKEFVERSIVSARKFIESSSLLKLNDPIVEIVFDRNRIEILKKRCGQEPIDENND